MTQLSGDKLRSLQLLSRKGIGLPVTGFARAPDDIEDLIKMVGGAPLVIKLLEGTQGIGVVLAETQEAAEIVRVRAPLWSRALAAEPKHPRVV
jgi:ribosomal protein S6--L-glutamate ligase